MKRGNDYMRACLILGFLGLLHFGLSGQSMTDAYQKLTKEDYKGAEEIYKQLMEEEKESAALYYNLGMANFYQDDIVEAVLYLEKAIKLKPNYKSAQKNLEQVKAEMTDSIYEIKPFFLRKFWNTLMGVFPLIVWRTLSLLAIGLLVFGIYQWLLSNGLKEKRKGFIIAAAALVIAGLFIALQNSLYSRLTNYPFAIVVEQAPHFQGPNELSELEEKYIPAGTKVEKLEQSGDWVKIKLPDAEQAYLKIEMLRDI